MRQFQTTQIQLIRNSREELVHELDFIRSDKLAVSILDGIPTMVLVLNKSHQLLFCNKAFLNILNINSIDAILGMRPGELMGCPTAKSGPDGCGTSNNCKVCGGLKAIKSSLEGIPGSEECTIKAGPSAMMHLKITTETIKFGEKDFILYSMQDISSEKKKILLERIFYHDILNSAHNINTMAELISDKENDNPESKDEYLGLLMRSTNDLIDEINTQRILSNGNFLDYISHPVSVSADSLFHELKSEFESISQGGILITVDKRSENFSFNVDKVLLRRIVTNMMANAIEAERNRGKITIGMMSLHGKGAMIWVHNKSFMSEEVQIQVFNRSFSTKGADRGLGTYSMKVLTEKFMKGKISFTSSKINGTTFIIEIPSQD
jgi:hypothetical protein